MHRPTALVLGLIVAPALGACQRTPAPPPLVVDARPIVTTGAAAAPAAAPDLATAKELQPTVCEVEITGKVQLPKGRKGVQADIIVAHGDCLGDGRVIGRARSAVAGTFFIEVFSDWGADLTVCAALEEAVGKPTKLYGKAQGPFHAEARGEVEFKDVRIELKAGAPRAFSPVTPRG